MLFIRAYYFLLWTTAEPTNTKGREEIILEPKAIEQEALRLSLEDHAQLAQKLLLSLDTLSQEGRDDAWLTEASRRARELDRWDVQPVSADAVERKAKALLR